VIQVRLNRYLASCGVASRRSSDRLIEEGKIFVNGVKALVGQLVNPESDRIEYNGKLLSAETKAYYLFNKPFLVLTTLEDPQGRKTVSDFIKNIPERIFPVGRLDYDSEGLLFLTNDGTLAHRIQHPKYELEKEYIVKMDRELNLAQEENFRNGILLEEGKTSAAGLEKIGECLYRVILHQGWHRQIRRMMSELGAQVLSLKRVRVGHLVLDRLRPGELRKITAAELKELKKLLF